MASAMAAQCGSSLIRKPGFFLSSSSAAHFIGSRKLDLWVSSPVQRCSTREPLLILAMAPKKKGVICSYVLSAGKPLFFMLEVLRTEENHSAHSIEVKHVPEGQLGVDDSGSHVNTYDSNWKKQWFGAGIFLEGDEAVEVDVVKKLEKKKVLSGLEKAGILSKAEELGFTLSSIEKMGLLSKAEELGLLSLAEKVASISPAALASISLPLVVAAIATVVLIPDDSTALVIAQNVLAAVFAAGAVGICAKKLLMDEEENWFSVHSFQSSEGLLWCSELATNASLSVQNGHYLQPAIGKSRV
eukprot:Gb_16180 [translate_table: standard]